MFKSPHSLPAMNRLFWKKKKNAESVKKKKTELTHVRAGQGADVWGFSLAFVFKRQSTVKTKQMDMGCVFLFFLDLLYCNNECELWSHELLRGNGST